MSKLCKDCKWCEPEIKVGIFSGKVISTDYHNAVCAHASAVFDGTDGYVDGKSRTRCSHWRGNWKERDVCGSTGKHFEPKP